MNQLIKSISGIRGVIGGTPENSLNPFNIVRFTAARQQQKEENEQCKLFHCSRH